MWRKLDVTFSNILNVKHIHRAFLYKFLSIIILNVFQQYNLKQNEQKYVAIPVTCKDIVEIYLFFYLKKKKRNVFHLR